MSWLALVYGLTLTLPAVACIPCGRDHKGMPFGIQVAGPRGSDARVLAIAKSLSEALEGDAETARPVPDLAPSRWPRREPLQRRGVDRQMHGAGKHAHGDAEPPQPIVGAGTVVDQAAQPNT
jgi:hypothetical protein